MGPDTTLVFEPSLFFCYLLLLFLLALLCVYIFCIVPVANLHICIYVDIHI